MDNRKLILFEYKDLLATSHVSPEEIAASIAAEMGIPVKDAEKLVFTEELCAFSANQTEKRMAPYLNGKNIGTVVASYLVATRPEKMNVPLLEFIDKLQQAHPGQVKVGVLANAFWFSTPNMKETLPDGMFDFFFQSGDLRCRKPWPQMYHLVESITGFSGNDIILFDSNYANVQAARAEGWVSELASADSPVGLLGDVITAILGQTSQETAPTEQPEPVAVPANTDNTATPAAPAVDGEAPPDSPAATEEPKDPEKGQHEGGRKTRIPLIK